jgi:hypothetical protein
MTPLCLCQIERDGINLSELLDGRSRILVNLFLRGKFLCVRGLNASEENRYSMMIVQMGGSCRRDACDYVISERPMEVSSPVVQPSWLDALHAANCFVSPDSFRPRPTPAARPFRRHSLRMIDARLQLVQAPRSQPPAPPPKPSEHSVCHRPLVTEPESDSDESDDSVPPRRLRDDRAHGRDIHITRPALKRVGERNEVQRDEALSDDDSEEVDGMFHSGVNGSPESLALAEVCQSLLRCDVRDPPAPFQHVALDQLTAFSQLEESQHEAGACDVQYERDGGGMRMAPTTDRDPLFDLFATPMSQSLESKKT